MFDIRCIAFTWGFDARAVSRRLVFDDGEAAIRA
jgi:hypothetical protein